MSMYYVSPRSIGYRDVTVTYIRRAKIPSRMYAKHQYKQELKCGKDSDNIHSNNTVQLHRHHRL